MTPSFSPIQFRRVFVAGGLRVLSLSALVACLVLAPSAMAEKDKGFAPATLVEAATYLPCSEGCTAFTDTVAAFCFRQEGVTLVGEGKSYLHEGKFTGVEELTGKQLQIRIKGSHLWIKPPDGPVMKIERGSLYENFKDTGCLVEVRKPIVAEADAHKRPEKVSATAFALAGTGKGDAYLWYECDLNADKSGISCRKWYKNGDDFGKEWYCARTMDGVPVAADFELDPLLSQPGKLVLKSGGVIPQDHRARTGDLLDRPGEACR